MKNKPTRHKETNTFQFKPFSERINEIDVDVFHRVAHRNEVQEGELETYFHQTLNKWNFLNLTEGYCSFKKQVRSIVTLPQLINQKQFVIDTLIEYLKKKDVLFLQPMLELVVAVAKDLQKDFYEHFPQFLSVIIDLLHSKDIEQIEYAFTCLAYLFKFLWRYLVKKINTVFDLLLPLLADTQPVYINNFAAESFSFVVRKVKDKNDFLRTVLETLEDRQNGVSGFGKLLFEVVSGTTGQFHSCAEQMLPIFFDTLHEVSVNQAVAHKVLKQIVTCITQNIHPQKSGVLWTALLNAITKCMEKSKTIDTGDRQPSLALLMQLLVMIVDYKNGTLLIEPVPLVKKLVQAMDMFRDREEVLKEILDAAVAILLASNVKLMQETSSQIVLKIMSIQNSRLLYATVEKLINYSSFETLVLPHILKHCVLTGFDDSVLQLLAKIVKTKAPPSCNGRDLTNWKKYILDVRGIQSESTNYLKQKLKGFESPSSGALKVLMILPHLKPFAAGFKDLLKEVLVSTYRKVVEQEQSKDLDRFCLTFLLSVESALHIFEAQEIQDCLIANNCNILELVKKFPNNRIILNTTDLLITYFAGTQFQEQYINETVFTSLHESIGHQLSSPFSETRLIITHLYSLFSGVKEITFSTANTGKSVLDLMLLAECESATVQNFRDKLLHLQSLTFENNSVCNLNSKFHDVPLRFLLGNLYINFSLLWEPVTKTIATYATKECESFWPVFLSVLAENPMPGEDSPLFECEIISGLEDSIRKSADKPDYNNYKILLWKCMGHFPQFCEAKNRDLTGLFIEFVNENFFKTNSEDAKCCCITKTEGVEATEDLDDTMQIDESDDEEENADATKEGDTTEEPAKAATIKKDQKKTKSKSSDSPKQALFTRSYKIKLLLAQLQIFEKIVNPKTLYREPEIQRIYLDLLCSKNVDIQKAALNCLFTYKYKYLLPYKENLYSLISEKNFKHELARFRVDTDSNAVQEEHRDDFIPILMRIIYSKMVVKTGMRTGGKAGGHVRRKMILRFLAGTQETEMIIFTKMAFKPFKKYLPLESNETVNLEEIARNLMGTVDLNNVIPPKRLQSTVNLLAILIEQFGSKMADRLLPYLLGLIICILAEITGILQKSDQVHPRYLASIKMTRTSCISILARFFEHFEDYPWKQHEINALFDVAVFPWVEKLPMEGIHSPTPLLKLFVSWSQNSRYYPLFIKHREDNKDVSPLPFVMRLLLGPKTHQSVANAILSMIEKMVTLQDYGRTVEAENEMQVDTLVLPMQPILNNLLDIRQDALDNGVNYGSTILLPHVFDILEYIKNKLKNAHKGVNKTELVILSRISEFVTDGEACDVLLSLTLPILTKRASMGESEETMLELLTTAVNLVRHVKSPEIHIRGITPLLGSVSSAAARKLLIKLYSMIAHGSAEECREKLVKNCDVLIALNAWDSRWIDQPDFQKRLDAFSEVKNMAEKNELDLDFGVAIIYNCFYFLKNDSDLAMKDFAGQCLKAICPKLAKEHQENSQNRHYFMDDTILPILKKGIVHKTEAVRLQSIGLLGHMAMECPEVHVVLRDLALLTNKVDPEVDFFENMQHLQLHRKSRALLKFCAVAKTLKKAFNPRTLTQFILPLACSYLCNETFAHKNNMVDSAIDVIGTVCKLLPWHQYEVILKYYLIKLRSNVEYQKQLVRIVVAILDAFHYDLSKLKASEIAKESESLVTKNEVAVVLPEDKKTSETKEETGEEDKEADDEAEKAEEKLDEALSSEHADNIEESAEKEEEKVEQTTPILERQIVLSQSGARRIVFSISRGLLPQLHRAVIARTRHESSHKLNKKHDSSENEEEELMRVPIALALVKLLQKLPEDVLEANLPGIFMKLCTFLKSRLDSVRRVTREVLQKIMVTLGPKYLHHLLKEMNTLLTKGFQVHVLAYTVHSVLVVLKPYFQQFDINNNLQSILSVCKVDLFGLTSEEKEVIGITKAVSEARATKSYDIFHILAQFITETCLLDLVLPLKEVLGRTHSHKTVQKVSECLRKIVLGLADNTFISLHQMLIFTYGIISESIPELLPEKAKKISAKEADAKTRSKPDCFLIAPEPKNQMGVKASAKTWKNTNAHVITEFGLKLCLIFLKRDKISDAEFQPFIDPFVPILTDCLKSQHIKLSSLALQCLTWLLRMDLSSIKDMTSEISTSIFEILHKYAAAGLSKGDNFDLVVAAFKCVAVIVRDIKHFSLNIDQFKLLIVYAEQDLYDDEKQATAFRLLKAIIGRKINIPEIHPVMEKVANLSITSELEHVKQQSRSVFYSYLMEYPLGKFLDKHISFYLTQLSYELQPGRLSALEMLHSIITGFPIKALLLRSDLIFLMAGARLVNDDDPECRKLCAKCIKDMITRIPYNKRSKLFEIIVEWLKDYKMAHRTLAAQLGGIFVTVEKDKFDCRLKDILPLILKQFDENSTSENVPGRFVRICPEQPDTREIGSKIKDPERLRDHHLFQVLQLLLKISAHCPDFLKRPEHKESVRMFAEHCQYLLGHPHVWVRLASSQMLGFVLAALDVQKVISLLENPNLSDVEDGYIYFDTENTLKSLTLDLIAQLHADMTFEELADQVIKNLIFIAKILRPKVVVKTENTGDEDEEKGKDMNELSLSWLVRRMRKVVNVEVTQNPKSTAVRTAVFKWIAGIVATIPIEDLHGVLFHIMSPLVREMSSTEEANKALRRLAKEAATMIKKRLGAEEYAKLLSKVQQRLDVKKAERRKLRTQQFITDPELTAKRKIAKQQKKKEAKKRKIDGVRGKKNFRKRPREEVDLDII